METIESKVEKLQTLSKKQAKLDEIKQNIADILWWADIEEKKKIAEKMSKTTIEDINQKRNLQFIVPHIVKELYEHEGPKGGFTIPKKVEPIQPIIREEPESIEEDITEKKKEKPIKASKTERLKARIASKKNPKRKTKEKKPEINTPVITEEKKEKKSKFKKIRENIKKTEIKLPKSKKQKKREEIHESEESLRNIQAEKEALLKQLKEAEKKENK